jgi:hypothetical protein
VFRGGSRVSRLVAHARTRLPGAALAADLVEAALLLHEVEEARWSEGPGELVSRLRARGIERAARSPAARLQLSRVIYHLDRLMHREPNCYRRSLTRIALEREAASEPFVLGLDLQAEGARGHAWVEGTTEAKGAYDVEFRV